MFVREKCDTPLDPSDVILHTNLSITIEHCTVATPLYPQGVVATGSIVISTSLCLFIIFSVTTD